MKNLIANTINLRSGNPDEKRKEIREYFLKTWSIHEQLYTQLKSDEIFYHRGDPLRHIILFYLGHTAVFFMNKLYLGKIIDKRINSKFESIFAIGVDEMSWDDLDGNHYEWPPVSEVRKYRDDAKKAILNIIDTLPMELPIDWENPFWIVMMGIEHERIHLETSSVLIRQLPLNEVVSNFGNICKESGAAPENELIDVKGGLMNLGKDPDHPFYGWDNEYGKYKEEVSDFKAAKYLTSNGEFLQFVNDGGYKAKQYWTEEGWNWCTFKEAEMPLFWRKDGDNYKLRLVAEEIDMPWDWPAEVNYLEAKAFCNWKTEKTGQEYRLPTEAEWYRLHESTGLKDVMDWDKAPGNINLEYVSSPCPVNKFKQGDDFYDVLGNVWQWTETPITGYPGFRVHPLYDDFSTPTFDGKHNIIKGGSWISTGNEATIHSRYAFRRHFYQHAGFRYIQTDAPLKIQSADYEMDAEVALSCENNWGDIYSSKDAFGKRLSEVLSDILTDNPIKRVLDLNADTGRLAFELSQHYDDITALDFTARMIRMPIQLQEQGYMRYTIKDEGEIMFFRDVVLSDYGLESRKDKILFMQGDPMNLRPNYTGYDLVVAPSILEELSDPKLFLSHIHERINDNGYLVILSSYDWDEAKTPRDKWIGGFKEYGEPVTSLDGLKNVLTNRFDLINEPFDMPLSIRKSSRVTEDKLLQLTVWRKK